MKTYSKVVEILNNGLKLIDKEIIKLNSKAYINNSSEWIKEINDNTKKISELIDLNRNPKSSEDLNKNCLEQDKLIFKNLELFKKCSKPLDLEKEDRIQNEISFLQGEKEEIYRILDSIRNTQKWGDRLGD